MKQPLVITRNHDGLSSDLKEGPDNSFAYSRHVDFRKNATLLSILPATVKESGSVVTGLITDMAVLPSGKIVAIDSSGGVYERSTAGTWTRNQETFISTAFGMVYNLQQDTIYVPGLTGMNSITNADGRFGGTFTVNRDTFGALTDQSATTSSSTYTTTTAITESATHRLSFIPATEPLYSVKIWITTKGTGDLTVTMHDAAHNTLGSKVTPIGEFSNGVLNEFIFSSPIRMSVKPNASTYHFHITHGGGTASTVGSGTLNDFSSARYETLSNRLVSPTNGFHPILEFLQYYLIGNGRYVAAWEPISQSAPSNLEFLQHKLVFPSGYEVTSFATWDEFAVIGCEKRSTSAVNEIQDGKLFIWDGTSITYNRVIDVPEGSPYGLFSTKNTVFYFANGSWWAWSGGIPAKTFQLPNTDFEYTDTSTYLVNYPHTMTVRNSILLGAFPSETNSASIEHGVYSFGSRNKNYSESFGYSYTISSGTRTNGTLRIGLIKSLGDKTFVSWRDGTNYGVDKINPSSDPFSTGTWESLIIDNSRADKSKEAAKLTISFKSLPSGASVTPKYKIDRGDWVSGTTVSSGTEAKLNINKRYKEIQVGMELTATTATPEIIAVTLVWESLAQERD